MSQVQITIANFTKQAKAEFHQLYAHRLKTAVSTLGDGVVAEVDSTFYKEVYPGFKAVSLPKQYKEGELDYDPIGDFNHEAENRLYGGGLMIGRTKFEDLGNSPASLAALRQKIASQGTAALSKKDNDFFDAIASLNDYSGTGNELLCYDGFPLFSTSHPNASNLDAKSSTGWDIATLRSEIISAQAAWAKFKDPDGKDYIMTASNLRRNTTMVVNVDAYIHVVEVMKAMYLPRFTGNSDFSDSGGSTENVLRKEFNVVVTETPRIADTVIYMFNRDNGGNTPILWQNRVQPQVEVEGEGSSGFFEQEVYKYKVRFRGVYLIRAFENAYAITGKAAA